MNESDGTPPTLRILGHIRDILEDERDYWPLTVRQVFYRMVAKKGYAKTEKDYANLAEKINRARRAGYIPWDAIRDDKQSARYNPGHWSVYGFKVWLERQADRLRFHPALVQPCRIEVHVEAEGMLPQIARVAVPLGADVYSSGGFGSVTVQRDTALRMAKREVPTVVLSVGDYDPSGIALYQSFKENVLAFYTEGTEYMGTDWGGEGTCLLGIETGMHQEFTEPLFRRIAVTPEQIREHGFETAPAKKRDRRGDWDGETVQCEAIPSALLAEIVEDAILEHCDPNLIEELQELGDAVRSLLKDEVRRLNVTSADRLFKSRIDDLTSQVDPDEWAGGHDNDDDIDMEEGI